MYRIDALLKADQKLFHTKDLSLLWGISNKNTLYTSIKRYIDKGILIPLHKGFYATIPIATIDPLRLGIGYLHTFAYLSCEYILAREGCIFQKSSQFTLVSNRSSKFKIEQEEYFVRKLSDKYLYNPIGIVEKNGILSALVERAVADQLYFSPHYYFDNKGAISWKKVKAIQKEVYGV